MPYVYYDGFVYKKNPDGSRGERKNKKRMSREHAMEYMRALYAHANDKALNGFKPLDDNKWIAFFTNNFEDLADEIFSEKSIDKMIDMLDRKQYEMPRLFYWHVHYPIGQADWVDRVGHTVIAVGHYENLGGDKEIYDKFREYFRETTDQFMVSHGYVYQPRDKADNVYDRFLSFEISPIPVEEGVPANPLTVFKEVEEFTMRVITSEKRAKLEAILGPEAADRLLKLAEKYSDEIAALRLKYKEQDGEKEKMPPDPKDMMDGEPEDTEETEPEKKGEKEPEPKKKSVKKDEVKEISSPEELSQQIAQQVVQQVVQQVAQQLTSQVSKVDSRVLTLETEVKDLSDFVKLQFMVSEPASKSSKTLVPESDKQVELLSDKNKKQSGIDTPLKAMFPMFFETESE